MKKQTIIWSAVIISIVTAVIFNGISSFFIKNNALWMILTITVLIFNFAWILFYLTIFQAAWRLAFK